ncbi:hypothetical protein DINM_004089 [Dirofilaria immitis]|nr:hypothetical protein [Dirofilaria immitis]
MMQYLMKHFVPNEPTARSLCMSSSDGWEMTEDMIHENFIKQWAILFIIGSNIIIVGISKNNNNNNNNPVIITVRKCLKYPSYSYALKNENDEIIATRIANIIERPQLNETSKHDTPNEQRENQSKKMAISAIEISRLINKLESKIWHLIAPSTTKLLEFLIISTHEKYTGRGLMYELMTFDIMEQKRNGIQGGISEATAYNSQKLFAKLGYQVIYQINYDEWLDKDGKQIFNCDDGTNCAQLKTFIEFEATLYEAALLYGIREYFSFSQPFNLKRHMQTDASKMNLTFKSVCYRRNEVNFTG